MPSRWWAFRDLGFKHEGFYPPDLYSALWNFISDKGYAVSEWKYAHGWYEGGNQGAVGVWLGTAEIEKKYTLGGIYARWRFIWNMVPKPGSKEEKPPLVPKGNVEVWMNGFVVTDYLNTWSSRGLLRPFFDLRDRYFYRNRRKVLLDRVKQDGEAVLKDMQEFVSFLPSIK
jgi:hypothetical protein